MSSLTPDDGRPITHAERVRAYMEFFHISEIQAEFMIAIEDGEIYGDIISLDKDGNEIKPSK